MASSSFPRTGLRVPARCHVAELTSSDFARNWSRTTFRGVEVNVDVGGDVEHDVEVGPDMELSVVDSWHGEDVHRTSSFGVEDLARIDVEVMAQKLESTSDSLDTWSCRRYFAAESAVEALARSCRRVP